MSVDPSFGYWFSGLVDGEGSFNILQNKTGLYCRFNVGLRADDVSVLREIRRILGFGVIYHEKKRYTPGRRNNPAVQLVVQSSAGCTAVADLLTQFSLRTKKRKDFEIWTQAVRLFHQNRTHGNRWGKSALKVVRDSQLVDLKMKLEQGRCYIGQAKRAA